MPELLQIVFMGTPDFAVGSLKTLIDSGQHIAAVVTAPDKPAGRGKQLQFSPVKKYALEAGINPILQPTNLKSPEFIEELKSLKSDIFLVVAFRMLPEIVWAIPPKGTINLHASLLPDYRGAAPINWAIINGEKETGVTTFFIEKAIDTGKIIFQQKVPIHPDTNTGELHDVLMTKGARLLVKTVEAVASDNVSAIPQSEYSEDIQIHPAPKIFKEDCRINWNDGGKKIHDFIRGLSPYPAAWTEITDGKASLSLKIFKSGLEVTNHEMKSGSILTDGKHYLKIAIPDGFIDIQRLQLAGKKQLGIDEFLRGFKEINYFHIIQ